MKKGFSFVIVIVLVLLIGALGFFSYKLIFNEKKILVPDFSSSNVDEVLTWCKSQETNPCTFENDYSDTIVENGIIYQSISAGEELGDSKITFTVSLGKKFEVNAPSVDANTNKETIEKWKNDNGIINPIEYVEEYNDKVQTGYVIKVEPLILINQNETLKVYLSKGVDPSKEEKEPSDEDIEVEYGTYINVSEDKFIEKAKALGLKPNHNEDRDDYSSSIEKGLIVWHGSGSYVKNETINYGLSLGKGSDGDIYIKQNEYLGKTEDEFKKLVTELGLKPSHESDWDDYSDTVAKGSIVRHGYTDYVKDENIRYGLSLGKKESGEDEYFTIKEGAYVGKTEDEFKKIAQELGLIPEHNKDWDATSDTIEEGRIVAHGHATDYVKGEKFRYGLSLGKEGGGSSDDEYFTIKDGEFRGKTLDEFTKLMKEKGLNVAHSEVRDDDYSDTVAKGCILWHGSATDFKKGETIHYTLSLGKKDSGGGSDPDPGTKTVNVDSGKYIGKSESDFKSAISGLGLNASHDSSKDDYSSAAVGTVIWHASGTFTEGATVAYGLSKGVKSVYVISYDALGNYEGATYAETESALMNYFTVTCGFSASNVSISGKKGSHGAGVIESVTINGNSLGNGGNYPINSQIVVVISTGFDS